MDAEKRGRRAVEITYFSDEFHKENFSVFIPRKDRYDLSEFYSYGNMSRDENDRHIKGKDEAKEEITLDKESSSTAKSVWTMDHQVVLLCPKTKWQTPCTTKQSCRYITLLFRMWILEEVTVTLEMKPRLT